MINYGTTNVDVFHITPQGSGVPYPGIGATVSSSTETNNLPPLVEIPTGSFEDYSVNYEATRRAFVYGLTDNNLCSGQKEGKFLTGLECVGIHINDNNEATNFISNGNINNSSYIVLPSFSTVTSLEFISKFKLIQEETRHRVIFASTAAERYVGFKNGNKPAIYDNGWINGISTLNNNKIYWAKILYNDNTLTYYIIEDNGYTLSTLPDSGWSQEIQVTNTTLLSTSEFLLGCNIFSSLEDFGNGIFYLNDLSVKVNGTQLIHISSSPAVTTARGSKLINEKPVGGTYKLLKSNDWFIQANRSNSAHYAGDISIPSYNYLQKSEVDYEIKNLIGCETNNNKLEFSKFDMTSFINGTTDLSITSSQTMEVQVHFNTKSLSNIIYNSEKEQIILTLSRDLTSNWSNGLDITSRDGKIWIADKLTTGYCYSGWGEFVMNRNKDYWINLLHTPTTLSAKVSEDGESWTEFYNANITSNINFVFQRLEIGSSRTVSSTTGAGYFVGKIYEEGTFVKIDNQLVWNLSIKE